MGVMTNSGNASEVLVQSVLATLGVDYDMTVEAQYQGAHAWALTSPDTLMDELADALRTELDAAGAVDFAIGNTDSVLSLVFA